MTTPPSTLVLLSELGTLRAGSKVRFLGCVISYDIPTATLTLASSFPAIPKANTITAGTSDARQTCLAHVEGSIFLDTTTHRIRPNQKPAGPSTRAPSTEDNFHTIESFEEGAWVNVTGYIREGPPRGTTKTSQSRRLNDEVYVQGIMIWGANGLEAIRNGGISERYSHALLARKEAGKMLSQAAREAT